MNPEPSDTHTTMKKISKKTQWLPQGLGLWLAYVTFVGAVAAPQSFSVGENGLQQMVPDNDLSGVARTVTTKGLNASVQYDLTVQLTLSSTASGMFNGDYYAYLGHETSDGGSYRIAVLLNRVGMSDTNPSGYSDGGFNIQLNDSAKADVHTYRLTLGQIPSGALTGTWQPDGRSVAPGLAYADVPRAAGLGPLGTMDPNGTWTLFVADAQTGGTAVLTDWKVQGVQSVQKVETRLEWVTRLGLAPRLQAYGTLGQKFRLEISYDLMGWFPHSRGIVVETGGEVPVLVDLGGDVVELVFYRLVAIE